METFFEFDQDVYTLPVSYVYTFESNDKIIVNAPLSYVRIDNAEAYRMNINAAYRKNMGHRWSLTPSIGHALLRRRALQ